MGPRRWIDGERAGLRIVVPEGQGGRYTLSFTAAAFSQPRRLSLAWAGGAAFWQAEVAASRIDSYSVPVELAAGSNLLRLTTDGYAAPNDLDPNAGGARELSVSLGAVRLVVGGDDVCGQAASKR